MNRLQQIATLIKALTYSELLDFVGEYSGAKTSDLAHRAFETASKTLNRIRPEPTLKDMMANQPSPIITERDELIAARDLPNGLVSQAVSDLSMAQAEIERLRAALTNIEYWSRTLSPQSAMRASGDIARAALGGNHE